MLLTDMKFPLQVQLKNYVQYTLVLRYKIYFSSKKKKSDIFHVLVPYTWGYNLYYKIKKDRVVSLTLFSIVMGTTSLILICLEPLNSTHSVDVR